MRKAGEATVTFRLPEFAEKFIESMPMAKSDYCCSLVLREMARQGVLGLNTDGAIRTRLYTKRDKEVA